MTPVVALQLTQYDDRGWRATFYNYGDRALAHERDGHRAGAHTVARDAAGGVGGAQAGGSELIGSDPALGALERPRGVGVVTRGDSTTEV